MINFVTTEYLLREDTNSVPSAITSEILYEDFQTEMD